MGCSRGHCCTLLANAVPPLIVPVVGVRLDVHLQHSSARMGVLTVAQDEARPSACNVMNSKGPSAVPFEDHCSRSGNLVHVIHHHVEHDLHGPHADLAYGNVA
jgi:hypothetical protein